MKRLISVLVLAFSFAAFAQGSAAPAGDKPAAEKGEKKQKAKKSGKKSEKKSDETKPETAK
jgi:hypothetical protein